MMRSPNPLTLVYIISFVDLFAIGLTFPLLASHLRDLGASHFLIGFMSSVYSGIQVLSGPIIGGWTDIKGRKSILIRILLICGICYGMLGLTESFSVIIILRIILGVVKHIQSICKAVITDILPYERHTEAFGRSAAISGLGFILGPFIGGQISEVHNGFRYVCFLTMVLFLINMAVASYLPSDRKKDKTGTAPNNFLKALKGEVSKTAKDLISIDWTRHWAAFTLRFIFSLGMTTFFSNQGILLKEKYKLSQKHSGYVISYFSTIGTFSAFFLDQFDRFFKTNNHFTKLRTFFTAMALSVTLVYFTSNLATYLTLLVPFSVSCTALRILSMELILHNSDGDHRGSLSGASNSVMSISRFITPLVTGALADLFGEEIVVLATVVPAMAGVFLCIYLKSSQRPDFGYKDD